MTRFRYKALGADGSEVAGTCDAVSEAAAFDELKTRGLAPTAIQPVRQKRRWLAPRSMTRKQLSQTIRQLATLISAGVPLLEAIDSIRRNDAHPKIAESADLLKRHLRSGQPLAAGFREHFPSLPGYVPSLVELGVETGRLAEAMQDAADRMAADDKLNSDLRSALAYPVILGVIGTVIVLGMFLFVIPRFGALIDRSSANVPWISRTVIEIALIMRENWILVVLGVGSLVTILPWIARRYRAMFRQLALSIPGIGKVLRNVDLAVWSRTVGLALSNGASLMTALDLAQRASADTVFASELPGVRRSVRSGSDLATAVETNFANADPMLIDLIQTGTRSGKMDKMLLLASELYEEDVRTATKRLTSIAEPLAILLLSIVVGGLVISIVLAMTSLYQFDF